MIVYQWMQSFKAENQRKTVLLLVMFPVLLILIFWVIISLFFTETGSWEEWLDITLMISPLILLVVGIWWLVSFLLQKDIMFWLSWAKAIERKDNPQIYNIVENLCISRWLPMPKIAIMDEPWMNAFATWWKKDDSWIAFTSGLLQKLNRDEIEAVAWHELTHLINRDSLLMYVAYVFVWIVTVVGEIIIRTGRSSNSKKSGWIFFLWLAFLVLWYLFYPLLRLAVSRKREYMADLWSVELTRDSKSMISALQKISNNSYVAMANNKVSPFFIAEVKKPSDINWSWLDDGNIWKKKIKTSIRDSHPSIDDRIDRLKSYR